MTNENESPLPVITVAGAGPGELEQMPLGVYRAVQQAETVIARTHKHPAIQSLQHEGFNIESFDHIYESYDHFEQVYAEIVEALERRAADGPVCYLVPGHPYVAEQTVHMLKLRADAGALTVISAGGQSFLDPMFTAAGIDPNDGCQLKDATTFYQTNWSLTEHLILSQVYDSFIASDVKLTLLERLPSSHKVTVVTAAGTREEVVETVPLEELDRAVQLSNLTAVYVPPAADETLRFRDFSKLREVIQTLRGPDGCPWDQKQTHASLKRYLLEETYEVLEAIDEEDDDALIEELGDILLQVMLHAQIGEDEGFFAVEDVIETLNEKMIRRHPHVFGKGAAGDADEVVTAWDAIKAEEKAAKNEVSESLLADVPQTLPALLMAEELQKKAARVGFDWGEAGPIWEKLEEELSEWKVELESGTKERASKELGDVLFVLCNLARFYKLNSEEALTSTNQKFTRRFQYIEQALYASGKAPEDASLEEMDGLWNEAKQEG
ncbi:nucleoside triphosphate pyrophosphohydrolase [Salsuginibacillus halophilus]|nr:nucleoside triphosphate pyrophosphohydrolase [Salsuginibacillus halophilus]